MVATEQWNRFILTWVTSHHHTQTDIPISGSADSQIGYEVTSIAATSFPEGTGEVVFSLGKTPQATNLFADTQEILNRLKGPLVNGLGEKHEIGFGMGNEEAFISVGTNALEPLKFEVSFSLNHDMDFCDFALEIVKTGLEALSVQDEAGYILGNFSINEQTMMKVGKSWTPLDVWLRIKHQLPYTFYTIVPKLVRPAALY